MKSIGPALMDTLYKMAISMAHLWIIQHYLVNHQLPNQRVRLWIYTDQLGWGQDLLKGKRVQLDMEIVKQ